MSNSLCFLAAIPIIKRQPLCKKVKWYFESSKGKDTKIGCSSKRSIKQKRRREHRAGSRVAERRDHPDVPVV